MNVEPSQHELSVKPTSDAPYPAGMRRKLVLIMITLFVVSGAAFADRGHRGKHKHKHKRDRITVRDHRDHHRHDARPNVRDHRDHRHHRHGPRVKHVRVNNGRYVFPGGVVRVYKRPVIRKRYRNRYVRPAVVVEHYDPVPGYVWVQGNWTWAGAEWVWTPGYWSVAAYSPPPPPPPTATMSGGISVKAGISIR